MKKIICMFLLSVSLVSNAWTANVSEEFCSEIISAPDCYSAPGCFLSSNNICTICPAGYYCEKNSSTKTPCPDNTKTSLPGATAASGCDVMNCGIFKFESECANAPSCYLTTRSDDDTTCFDKGNDADACNATPGCQMINGSCGNAMLCKNCEAGYYCIQGAENICEKGYYCPANSSQHIACPIGYTSDSGAESKDDCYIDCEAYNILTEKKQFCTAAPGCQWKNNKCQVCESGYYCPTNSEGKKCPLNAQSVSGATAKKDCYIDKSNKVCDSSGNCYTLGANEKYYYKPTPQEQLIVPIIPNWPSIEQCMPESPLPC
ncbi:MAG: hypothetical protein IKL14_04085 [Alphaproteobacteria bacterium]|nr:hypothetical protein [Alphaproteobacteria bacterium]